MSGKKRIGKIRGYDVEFDPNTNEYSWVDSGDIILSRSSDRRGKFEINCAHCDQSCFYDEPDPCLDYLPGVEFACCGHGDHKSAYIKFTDGLVIRGFDVIEYDWRDNAKNEDES